MTSLSLFTFMHWRRKWQPTPVFFPGEFQGRGSLAGCHLWGRTELDKTDATSQQHDSIGALSSLSLQIYLYFYSNSIGSNVKIYRASVGVQNSPLPFLFALRSEERYLEM